MSALLSISVDDEANEILTQVSSWGNCCKSLAQLYSAINERIKAIVSANYFSSVRRTFGLIFLLQKYVARTVICMTDQRDESVDARNVKLNFHPSLTPEATVEMTNDNPHR